MLIRLCAWHRMHFGRPRLLGLRLIGWPWRLMLSHGICRRCRLIEDVLSRCPVPI